MEPGVTALACGLIVALMDVAIRTVVAAVRTESSWAVTIIAGCDGNGR